MHHVQRQQRPLSDRGRPAARAGPAVVDLPGRRLAAGLTQSPGNVMTDLEHYALRGTADARVIAALELEFPHWQCWIVYPVIGPKHWHARRWEDVGAIPVRVIDADSAVELIEKIEDAISGVER